MRIGWIGLGKLGLPIAEEIAKTHEVWGWDIDARRLAETDRVRFPALGIVGLTKCDLVFVSVQTPHAPEFEGITRLPAERADFDYGFLTDAVSRLAASGPERPPLVIVSTVLPGTIEREILPLWDGPVLYNPFFIAMGEEVADFLKPEFVLVGYKHKFADYPGIGTLRDFYDGMKITAPADDPLRNHYAPFIPASYREAELAKMAYNTFIGLKIAFANTIGELCDRLGCDADQVLATVRAGRKRITSGAYLSAGMGDGGPCHPRDNIALSWLARETGLSFDLFSAVMEQREAHADWLVEKVAAEAGMCDVTGFRDPRTQFAAGRDSLPMTVLGRAYKPGTELETGSPGLLVAELLRERGVEVEHVEDL